MWHLAIWHTLWHIDSSTWPSWAAAAVGLPSEECGDARSTLPMPPLMERDSDDERRARPGSAFAASCSAATTWRAAQNVSAQCQVRAVV